MKARKVPGCSAIACRCLSTARRKSSTDRLADIFRRQAPGPKYFNVFPSIAWWFATPR